MEGKDVWISWAKKNILIMIAETDIKLKSGIYDDYSILKNLINFVH